MFKFSNAVSVHRHTHAPNIPNELTNELRHSTGADFSHGTHERQNRDSSLRSFLNHSKQHNMADQFAKLKKTYTYNVSAQALFFHALDKALRLEVPEIGREFTDGLYIGTGASRRAALHARFLLMPV